jgi:hypothetical protein
MQGRRVAWAAAGSALLNSASFMLVVILEGHAGIHGDGYAVAGQSGACRDHPTGFRIMELLFQHT